MKSTDERELPTLRTRHASEGTLRNHWQFETMTALIVVLVVITGAAVIGLLTAVTI